MTTGRRPQWYQQSERTGVVTLDYRENSSAHWHEDKDGSRAARTAARLKTAVDALIAAGYTVEQMTRRNWTTKQDEPIDSYRVTKEEA